ncbi:phage tail protein, partial [Escherichia coli]
TADSGEYQVLARWDTPKVVKGVSFMLRLTVAADDGSERLVSTARTAETTYRFTQLALGNYRLTVRAVNARGQQGDPASVSFRIAAPAVPSRIELTPGYFQITATPHLAVYDPTVQFEFWFSETRITDIRQVETTARYLGTALYWIAASINIKPGHDYYFYIRSVNTVGKSAFVEAVSYTHLDVYKRQEVHRQMAATHTLPLASPGMARICLYGDLQRFGRRIDLRVKTGSEAIRALAMQIPAFRQKLSDGWYQVRIAGRDAGETELSARLNEPLANGAVIHIVPRLAGAKSGGVFQVVLGAALIAVSWWNPVGWLGAAAVSGMYAAGASMILGGVAQMLAPKARTPTAASTDNGKQNTYFSSLDNMVAQGNVLPVLYGEMRVGSRVVSQEISTADEGDGGQVVVIGR